MDRPITALRERSPHLKNQLNIYTLLIKNGIDENLAEVIFSSQNRECQHRNHRINITKKPLASKVFKKMRNTMRALIFTILLLFTAFGHVWIPNTYAESNSQTTPETRQQGWKTLFDGKTLDGWKLRKVGDEGTVCVEEGAIRLNAGATLNSITYDRGDFPTDQYELELEAMRLDGSDFFATTTFPVGDEYCSFVVGGWGGGLVGISSIDRMDASENSTSTWHSFKNNQWYQIRIRVNHRRIECFIDDEQFVDFKVDYQKLSTRFESSCCEPMGIGTWCTSALVRNIRMRRITDDGKPTPLPMEETEKHGTEDESVSVSNPRTAAVSDSSPCERVLFDGKTLDGWKIVDISYFEHHGEVALRPGHENALDVEGYLPERDGELHLDVGESMTGIQYVGATELPTTNYELNFEAKRLEGDDFFAAVTFPVGKEFVTFVPGGWGGGVCGLSNVDGQPAVENPTTCYLLFENDLWYDFRLRVSDERIEIFAQSEKERTTKESKADTGSGIQADDAKEETPLINLEREGRTFSVWPQQELMRPLGFATWFSHGAIRHVRLRTLESD